MKRDEEGKTIANYVDELPTSGITVLALKSLDFVAPGEWDNITSYDAMLKKVKGETDPGFLRQVRTKSLELYSDPAQGYQAGLNLYQLVDSADKALGAAAFADKIGQKVNLLSFLEKLTPKADTTQTIDLSMKLIVELIAFTKVNGIPGDSFGDFVKALGEYGGESKIRMAALLCFDGLIPLGPDFVEKARAGLGGMSPDRLAENATFKRIEKFIPGNILGDKLEFVRGSFDSVTGWMGKFVADNDLSVGRVAGKLADYVEGADGKLDYLGAFLDMSTNYFEHTGTQSMAIRLIDRAVNEV
ncbi:MAG: hypothetical protein O3C21_05820 [Verrucomicrobia bacterium]|nr:hypothetical protein [Verrucomicrobiota bacterium]